MRRQKNASKCWLKILPGIGNRTKNKSADARIPNTFMSKMSWRDDEQPENGWKETITPIYLHIMFTFHKHPNVGVEMCEWKRNKHSDWLPNFFGGPFHSLFLLFMFDIRFPIRLFFYSFICVHFGISYQLSGCAIGLGWNWATHSPIGLAYFHLIRYEWIGILLLIFHWTHGKCDWKISLKWRLREKERERGNRTDRKSREKKKLANYKMMMKQKKNRDGVYFFLALTLSELYL